MLLVSLWLWSNEDLLSLGFHENLMFGLSIQPSFLKLEASIPLCVVDASWSISHPAAHTILPLYWACAPFKVFCTFESLCLDLEIRAPSTTRTSTTQSRTALVEQPPLSSEPS